MKTIFYGLPAYVIVGDQTIDTTRPRALTVGDGDRARVVPFDNTPAFFLDFSGARITRYADCRAVEVPPSPLSYCTAEKTIAILNSGGTVFRVTDSGVKTVRSDDGLNASLPPDLRDVRLRAGELSGSLYFALSGRLQQGQYLFVAEKAESGWEVRIASACARAEQRNGATMLLTDLSAAGLVGTVTIYDGSFRVADTHPVYTASATSDDPVLLTFDYLSLRMDDQARALLSSELLADTPYEDVAAFFARYKTILSAPSAPGFYAMYKDPVNADLYRAILKDGQIADLIDAPHPLLLETDADNGG